jgi:hypothetical protein
MVLVSVSRSRSRRNFFFNSVQGQVTAIIGGFSADFLLLFLLLRLTQMTETNGNRLFFSNDGDMSQKSERVFTPFFSSNGR